MKKAANIIVYEHERLTTDHELFNRQHLTALLKLNELHNFEYFEPIANGIKFKQYVGIVRVNDLSIEILPKTDKNKNAVKWKHILLQMLKTCGHIKPSSMGFADLRRQNINLLEIYFELYLNEIDLLIRHGLIKKYRKTTGNLKSLKGKLVFSDNIKQNLVHKERFYTSHQIYDHNHKLHQILIEALDIIEQFSYGTYLIDRCKRTLSNFPLVSRKKIKKTDFDNFIIDRKTVPYTQALELARLIILKYSPDITSGKNKMISLLFDMNKLWEEFILKKIKFALAGSTYKVLGQDRKSFIGSNYLRPDIVIKSSLNPEDTFIIDTKWKTPINNRSSISDLRQIYTYNRFWNAKKALLLYPGVESNSSFKKFNIKDLITTSHGHSSVTHLCKSASVNILDEENKLCHNIAQNVLNLIEHDFS